MRRIRFQNSLVWSLAILASGIILKGSNLFLPMLLIQLLGAVASDLLLARGHYAVPGHTIAKHVN